MNTFRGLLSNITGGQKNQVSVQKVNADQEFDDLSLEGSYSHTELLRDNYYESVIDSLRSVKLMNLMNEVVEFRELVREWLVQAPNLQLESNQKSLNYELLSTIYDDIRSGDGDISRLKQFLKKIRIIKI